MVPCQPLLVKGKDMQMTRNDLPGSKTLAFTTRLVAALAAAMMLGSAAASAHEPTLSPETETLLISGTCPSAPPGECTSTRWLGKVAGDASSNFLTSTTPVDEVLYRAEGRVPWRDYPSDDSLRAEGYPLRSAEDITATVRLTATGIAANNTVHMRIEAVTDEDESVTFEPQQRMITVLPNNQAKVNFSFDIPTELEGVTLKSMTVFVAAHGVNVQGGYIDEQGGSSLKVPYWLEVTAP